ncbi:MAG: glycine--tRNA ligase subunit beta [Sandaracinaceae bacterium]
MSELLLEVGVEELPASFVERALGALPDLVADALARRRLGHGAVRALGTPRRLAVRVADVAARQADLSEVVLGPPKAAAFADAGTPRKAAVGFARKLGVEVDQLRLEETDRGVYVAARREEAGRRALEVLPDALGEVLGRIPFPKSMRWGDGDLAFGRPIHWIVALLDDAVLDLTFAGIEAGSLTRGHRFLAPDPVGVGTASRYEEVLRGVHVWVDPEERKARMRRALEAAAATVGGSLVADAFLESENASMVEEPHVLVGSFDEAFLELPDRVTVEVMRGHQRYFALRDEAGALLHRYLVVANTAEAPNVIVRGNDRVLRARLADARFFVEEDRKTPLAAQAARLEEVTFQSKLGTVAERVARLEEGGGALGDDGPARAAARLAKADQVTLIVGEFPELEGEMGRWYALKEGIEPLVADAIRDHYRPRGAGDDVPTSVPAARLAVADRADVLVGCFGIGLTPSGSADPFALRRATLGILRIALEGPIDVDLRATLRAAWAAYDRQGKPLGPAEAVLSRLDEFFRGRLRVHYGARFEAELVDACLGAWDGSSIRDLGARLRAIEAFRGLDAYASLAVAFKRAYNIAKDGPDGEPTPEAFVEEAERDLAERFFAIRPRVEADVAEGRYEAALTRVAEDLRGPVDRFFDEVFVMVDDDAVRDNRLRLLGTIARTLTSIAHFHVLGP